jgi:hypothetical protein
VLIRGLRGEHVSTLCFDEELGMSILHWFMFEIIVPPSHHSCALAQTVKERQSVWFGIGIC